MSNVIGLIETSLEQEVLRSDLPGVHGIPLLVLYREGEPVAHVVGAHPKHTIETALSLDAPTERAA